MEINIYGNRIIPRLNLWNLPNSKIDPLSFFSLRCLQSWFLLAQARPVTNRSDWNVGLPRRAFKTVLIDWSLVSAEKKRVGGRIQPPSPSSSLAENYLEKPRYPSLPLPPPPHPRSSPILGLSCLYIFFPTISCLFQSVTWHYNIS